MLNVCYSLHVFIGMVGRRAFCVERLATFSLPHSLPSTFHCSSVWRVPVFSRAWGLMAGLSGLASHWCSLHLGAGCQQWKPQYGSLQPLRHLTSTIKLITVKMKMLKGHTFEVYLQETQLTAFCSLCFSKGTTSLSDENKKIILNYYAESVKAIWKSSCSSKLNVR